MELCKKLVQRLQQLRLGFWQLSGASCQFQIFVSAHFWTMDEDIAVDSDSRTQYTASDAMLCKHSAVAKGYFEDALISSFIDIDVPTSNTCHARRRKPPIINRGYFARVHSIKNTIQKFMDVAVSGDDRRKQIVILGSGFDTLSLRLISGRDEVLSIYEVDFEKIIRRKVAVCLNDPTIRELLVPTIEKNAGISHEMKCGTDGSSDGSKRISIDDEGANYKFDNLHFLSGDLRDTKNIIESLLRSGIDRSVPTLILTECVMVYLEKSPTMDLCKAFSELLLECVWVTYDMISPSDVFGRTMLKNLNAARFHIPGFTDFPTKESQVERFIESGWNDARSITMLSVYEDYISIEEKHRIARLEIFDEIEEWQMLMSHYTLSVAVKGNSLISVLPIIENKISRLKK